MSDSFRHIFLAGSPETSQFTSPTSAFSGGPSIPSRDRLKHGARLRRDFENAWSEARRRSTERSAVGLPTREGVYLEFEGAVGHDLITKSLENLRGSEKDKVRLLNVHTVEAAGGEAGDEVVRATVYVHKDKTDYFLKKVRDYEEEETRSGEPRHAKLVNSIESIRLAVIESFWSDQPGLIPGDEREWCEIWLRGDKAEHERAFRRTARTLDIRVQQGSLSFPERLVVLAHVNRADLVELLESSPLLAEFRRAKETARFFLEMSNREQADWVADLQSRLRVTGNPSVSIAILDSGANNGHPLLSPLLADNDRHSVEPAWGVDDHTQHGHGTGMCGLAAYGELRRVLESGAPVEIWHCLSSVKILPPHGANDPRLYGDITMQAVSRAELAAAERAHIGCMAVTALDGREQGKPSSWSAALDALTSGYADDQRRLFIVAAGNTDIEQWSDYPESNLTDSIHDPGQSWNALTVGAYTDKSTITDPSLNGYTPLAPAGGLSPFSTTSLTWDSRKWPAKPDIVLEGGNLAQAPQNGRPADHDDLSLVTTGRDPQRAHFNLFNMTSAATAQASWMAAQIWATYPEAWPETVRGLLIHSAEWTAAMKQQFLNSDKKSAYSSLLRICGYGVPDLNRAVNCYGNALTLISQQEIQPFEKNPDPSSYRTREMHLYELPWPKDELLALGETPVKLRITLSYFIEPSPGEIGWQYRYRYQSHGLRFDLNNTSETRDEFVQRINAAARDESGRPTTNSGSERWTIGANGRNLGSIHSDIWQGTAADLATCNLVGIYPVIGWWRERHWLNRFDRLARYALIVSVETPEIDVDIYTPVANRIAIPIEV